MTDAFMAHAMHADSALPSAPAGAAPAAPSVVAPPGHPPRRGSRCPRTRNGRRRPAHSRRSSRSISSPRRTCTNGNYVVSWGLPGDEYDGVEVRSPKDAVQRTSIDGYKVVVVLHGDATGDVRAIVDVAGSRGSARRNPVPARRHLSLIPIFLRQGCCDRVSSRAPLAQLAEQLALN